MGIDQGHVLVKIKDYRKYGVNFIPPASSLVCQQNAMSMSQLFWASFLVCGGSVINVAFPV